MKFYTTSTYSKIGLIAFSLLLNSCGKKSKSQEIQITVEPKSPIVFTSDTKIRQGDDEIDVKAPWFSFSVRIDNHLEDSSVTISSLHVEVTGFDKKGELVTEKSDHLPSTANYSTDLATCTYSDFGQFDAGGRRLGAGGPVNNELLYSVDPSSTSCKGGTWTFYISGNPDPGNSGNLHYQVKVQPMGWFGSRYEQLDRFDNSMTFSTR